MDIADLTNIRSIRRKLISERGLCCERCHYDNVNVLQVHHIIERSKGGTDDPLNLLLLCPNCHYTIHHGDSRKEPNAETKRILKLLTCGKTGTK